MQKENVQHFVNCNIEFHVNSTTQRHLHTRVLFSNCQNRFLSFDASQWGENRKKIWKIKKPARNPQNHFWQRRIFYIRTSFHEFNKVYILFSCGCLREEQKNKNLVADVRLEQNMMCITSCVHVFSLKISYGWNL